MKVLLRKMAFLAGAIAIACSVAGAPSEVGAQEKKKKSVRFSTIVKRAKGGNADAQIVLGEAYEKGRTYL